jgi:glyoxylase-like metal-dependent hydrolase (beta-lactamase superfamily II)
MKQITPGVSVIDNLRGSNVYLLSSGENMTLVDTGMPGDFESIINHIHDSGLSLSGLKKIILTHSHMDHIGSAARIAQLSGAKILAHQMDASFITGQASYPTQSLIQKIVYGFVGLLSSRLEPISVDRILTDGDTIPGPAPLQVIHTPGHTPGSISLHFPERGILFYGDALFNAHPVTGKQGLRFPIRPVTLDRAAARKSVERLSHLEIKVLCPGHGKPVLDHPLDKINTLLWTNS